MEQLRSSHLGWGTGIVARIIAISNQKGGSGKSTTTVNLAATLAEKGKRVLLIDMDPQASATKWLNIRGAGAEILEAFLNGIGLDTLVRETAIPGVDAIPSSTWLAKAERLL